MVAKRIHSKSTENKGLRFGNKSLTLEMIGILLTFLLKLAAFKNKHVCIYTNNVACVYGMKDGYIKKVEYSSMFIRAIYLISGYLGMVVHVSHVPRRLNWETIMADNLTRQSTTTFQEKQILKRYENLRMPPVLTSWLKNPTNDLTIATDLLSYVM
jgi:hypothetical protein